jgi:diguanylate cyclase (GGDEF)-like protein
MSVPLLPLHEQERIASLIGLKVLDTPAEDRFDRITRIAAKLFKVPVALINLVDRDRQWTKSTYGLEIDEIKRDVSFCAHAILERDILVVPDARKDVRFADNPFVTGKPRIRFYAGAPVCAPDGHKIGTVCILDYRRREPSKAMLEMLRDLAHIVENELAVSRLDEAQAQLLEARNALRRRSVIDAATRAWSRESILDLLDRELKRIRRQRGMIGVALVQVDRFDRFKAKEAAAEHALRVVAQQLRSWTRAYDAIGHYNRDTFLVVMPGCEAQDAAAKTEMCRRMLALTSVEGASRKSSRITLSVGVTDGRGAPGAMLRNAESALRRARQAGGNAVVIA